MNLFFYKKVIKRVILYAVFFYSLLNHNLRANNYQIAKHKFVLEVVIDQFIIDSSNETAVSFSFLDAEIGNTYTYSFSSNNGAANVTGNGIINATNETVSEINLSQLENGTITLTVTLTNTNNNSVTTVKDTIVKGIDTDNDGIENAMDPDDDNDGILDNLDSFPLDANNVTTIVSEAITPNNDGINDFWIIKGIEKYPDNLVQVYNRSGKVVYTKKGYANTWKGTYQSNSELLPTGSYYYSIDLGNNSALKKGWLFINY